MKLEIIPIQQQDGIRTVNARDLHEFLCVGKVFAAWIRERIEQYSFEEVRDFFPVSEKSSGGRPKIEYHLTLNMAKELAMVERSHHGKLARRYFIHCEQELIERLEAPPELLADTPAHSPRSLKLLHLAKSILDLGFSSKEATALLRAEFPPLTRHEQRIEELKAMNAQQGSFPLDPESLLFLSLMQPACSYGVADFFAALPPKHPWHQKTKRAWATSIGLCLQRLLQAGKVRKLRNPRKATYELSVQDNVIPMDG